MLEAKQFTLASMSTLPFMQPKLAHLFLLRGDLHHEAVWKKFFCGQKGRYAVYAHAKWPNKLTSNWLRKQVIPWHCETDWGDISLVRAEMLLLKRALQDHHNQFFLLHSESCVPLRMFEYIYRQIMTTRKSWIDFYPGEAERRRGIPLSRIPAGDFLKSSQFFCLSRVHAELILKNIDLRTWQRCWYPDEHCIPTTLSQLGQLDGCITRNITFSYWPQPGPSPFTFHALTQHDKIVLESTSSFFARKFAIGSDIGDYLPLPIPITSSCR